MFRILLDGTQCIVIAEKAHEPKRTTLLKLMLMFTYAMSNAQQKEPSNIMSVVVKVMLLSNIYLSL